MTDERLACCKCAGKLDDDKFESHGSRKYFRLKCSNCGFRTISSKIRYGQVDYAKRLVNKWYENGLKEHIRAWECVKYSLREEPKAAKWAKRHGIKLL